jgi:HSP20 family protein
MNLIRYDPFRELTQLQRHWLFHQNQGLDQLYGRGVQGEETQTVASTWTPLVDIFEDSETITLKVELPEVDANDVDIQLEGNALTLRGERKLERADKQEGYHRIERNYGSFGRTFTLPSTVEVGDITAESRDGVLRISLPKKAETKSRQIKVQTDSGLGGRDPQKQ